MLNTPAALFCVPCRAAIRRPMCGTCVQDSASSPLKPMNQTSIVCGKLMKQLCVCRHPGQNVERQGAALLPPSDIIFPVRCNNRWKGLLKAIWAFFFSYNSDFFFLQVKTQDSSTLIEESFSLLFFFVPWVPQFRNSIFFFFTCNINGFLTKQIQFKAIEKIFFHLFLAQALFRNEESLRLTLQIFPLWQTLLFLIVSVRSCVSLS